MSELSEDLTKLAGAEEPEAPVEEAPKEEEAAPDPLKALSDRLGAMETVLGALAERLRGEQPKPPEPPKEPESSFDTDPLGWTKNKLDKLERAIEQQDLSRSQQSQVNELLDRIRSCEAAFAKTVPDYHEALNHIRSIERKRMKVVHKGRNVPDSEIDKMIGMGEMQMAFSLVNMGEDPAAKAYELAQEVYGYVPKGKAESDKLERQKAGDIVSLTPGGTRGAKPPPESDDGGLDAVLKGLFGG